MTLKETAKIMSIIFAAYPMFYSKQSDEERQEAIRLWTMMFQHDDPAIVTVAVQALIESDEKGFPPVIGSVKAKIRQLTQKQEMTEAEAWSMVKKALLNASMSPTSRVLNGEGESDRRTSAERNYDALPELLKRIVGSPSQLADWAQLPPSDVETVVASNFMRSYRTRLSSDREFNALPEDVKQLITTGVFQQKQLNSGDREKD